MRMCIPEGRYLLPMTPGFKITSMILTSCQTHSVRYQQVPVGRGQNLHFHCSSIAGMYNAFLMWPRAERLLGGGGGGVELGEFQDFKNQTTA